jgi:hypothetical protein
MSHFYVLFCFLFLPGALARDTWDDFANNLATDLAPILQLFGEQVSKQFLSESTSIWDNIIFAMAPLGVLTAVVSAIRVCGSPVLRAFIGRAQEGAGIAEAELCSSTGRDLSEMYKNGGITRVFGRPKILEVIHDRQEENFYLPEGQGKVPTAGLYTFKEYYKTERGRKEWKELGIDQSKMGDEKLEPDEFAPYPNLVLNIGCKAPSTYALRLVALFAFLLQASVVIYAVVAQRYLKLTREGQLPPPWALPTMIVGTSLLCTGMCMCAWLVEQTTQERTFERVRKSNGSYSNECVLHWIQPGGQVVGDQNFDSFAYNDIRDPITCFRSSWRKGGKDRVREHTWTWCSVIITMTGFIVQFVGLRGCHSTVSIYQLCAVLLMCMIRGVLRRRRSNLDQNENLGIHDSQREDSLKNSFKGHELDWLSMQLSNQYSTRTTQTSSPWVSWSFYQWQLDQPNPGLRQLGAQRGCPLWVGISERLPQSDHFIDSSIARAHPPVLRRNSRWLTQYEAGEQSQPNAAARLWRYRTRLCQLTSPIDEASTIHAWPKELAPTRSLATALARAIAKAANLIVGNTLDKGRPYASKTTLYMRFLSET